MNPFEPFNFIVPSFYFRVLFYPLPSYSSNSQ